MQMRRNVTVPFVGNLVPLTFGTYLVCSRTSVFNISRRFPFFRRLYLSYDSRTATQRHQRQRNGWWPTGIFYKRIRESNNDDKLKTDFDGLDANSVQTKRRFRDFEMQLID